MTALQDWLSFSPMTTRSVKMFVCAPLRSVLPDAVLPAKRTTRYEPLLLRPGLERC